MSGPPDSQDDATENDAGINPAESLPVFISAASAAQVLDLRDVMQRLAAAYSMPISEEAVPPRVVARGQGVWMRTLAAIPPGAKLMGTKTFALGAGRSVNYVITLIDQHSGKIVAFVDAVEITALRTAATSAIAADRMTPAGAVSVGLLGSGLEASNHLWAIAQAREIAGVRIYSPTPANREAFAREASARLSLHCEAVSSPQEAVSGAGIIIAAARSYREEPILCAEWLGSDVTIVSIGSTLAEQRELDVSVIAAADVIVCDAPEEVAHETGDMIAASDAGVEFRPKLHSLNMLMMGQLDDALAQRSVRLFKSVGSALQDIVTAELVYERALERRLAVPLPISFDIKRV